MHPEGGAASRGGYLSKGHTLFFPYPIQVDDGHDHYSEDMLPKILKVVRPDLVHEQLDSIFLTCSHSTF